MVNLFPFIARSTLEIRHGIVRRIAPKVYSAAFCNDYARVPRPMIMMIKHLKGNEPLIGVEIGVSAGVNAESMMKNLNIEKLFLVDPYEPYFQDGKLWDASDRDVMLMRMEKFGNKYQFIPLQSEDAVSQIPDGLDFVYIDGNHECVYVKRDCENYYPKIKHGGLIGGHDFVLNDYEGLVNAVIQFVTEHNLTLQGARSDWWCQKTSRSRET